MTSFFKHKMRRKSPGEIVGWVILGTIAIVGLAILFGFVIMWLWNWLMPALFGLTTITYWQAVGLFILFKILLGGCGGGHKGCRHHQRSGSHCGEDSKSEFSKWRHYDKFWKDEGDKAYKAYVERMKNESNDDTVTEE
jgi:hypothetical protein